MLTNYKTSCTPMSKVLFLCACIIAAHSAYDVSWYKYLIVSLFFSHLGFWSGNLFLIAPFPDLCLLVPLYMCSRIASSI